MSYRHCVFLFRMTYLPKTIIKYVNMFSRQWHGGPHMGLPAPKVVRHFANPNALDSVFSGEVLV